LLRKTCVDSVKGKVHVTCSVVRDTTPSGRSHEGVCSTWLQAHAQGDLGVLRGSGELPAVVPVPVFIRHSVFRLPKDPSTPIIMVGPGTGLAPFRGFLHERAAIKLSQPGAALGPAHLFFGCRSRAQDYIYEAELEALLAGGALSNLHVAFSRDSVDKDYVQHHIRRQAGALWPLLAGGAHVYICGDAKHMAKDVHRALTEVVQEGLRNGGGEKMAEAFIKEMSEAGRYQRDVW